jgi:DNA-binding transcriptional ArsR family regulator
MREDLDRLLHALADPHRRRVVELLGERPLRAGELAQTLALAPPAVSRHLKVLKQSGLIEESHPMVDARVRIYSLSGGTLRVLKDWLGEAEASWTRQLAEIEAHAAHGPE